MKKVLVFGGAFNPPTLAHRDVLKYVTSRIDFDNVVVVPSSVSQQSSWKRVSETPFVSDSSRVLMCEQNFNKINSSLVVSSHEIDFGNQGIKTSSYDTLNIVKDMFPEHDIYFLIGDDKIKQITRWVNAKRLLEEFKFLVVSRNGDVGSLIENYAKPHRDSFLEVSGYIPMNISSTQVRESYNKGNPISGYVLNSVENIILKEKENNYE